MQSLHDLLTDAGFDVIGTIPLNDAIADQVDKTLLRKADLVIANGEGSYHHNRRPDFARIAKNYPTALINTVYQDNDDKLDCFRYIAARESYSQREIVKQVPCDIVPDVIFASRYLASIDPAKSARSISVQHYARGNKWSVNTMQKPDDVVPDIASSGCVTTGSFHAACVAAYYGKPMRLTASNTHKMEGLAEDMSIKYPSDEFCLADPEYASIAKQRIAIMVNKLSDL